MFRHPPALLIALFLLLCLLPPLQVFAGDADKDEKVQVVTVPPFIGQSEKILAIEKLLPRIAASEARVLLMGETGSGKDVYARRIHSMSRRKDHPFLAINVAELPESLAEGLLFGVRKGAYTGATSDQAGLLESANGGTVFLDELAEMPHSIQVTLLRALESKKFRRVGETKERDLDVRIISGTNRDLWGAVTAGSFRKDLYFRLAVFSLEIPSLRHRTEDLVPLVAHLVVELEAEQYINSHNKRFSAEAIAKLTAYPWPGNIRELRNVIEYAAIVSDGDLMEVSHLPPQVLNYKPEDLIVPLDAAAAGLLNPMAFDIHGKPLTVKEVVDRYCLETFEALGNYEAAARVLGMGARNLRLRVQSAQANSLLQPVNSPKK